MFLNVAFHIWIFICTEHIVNCLSHSLSWLGEESLFYSLANEACPRLNATSRPHLMLYFLWSSADEIQGLIHAHYTQAPPHPTFSISKRREIVRGRKRQKEREHTKHCFTTGGVHVVASLWCWELNPEPPLTEAGARPLGHLLAAKSLF